MTESYPLKWPLGRERTSIHQRKSANFKTTQSRAYDELMRQLKLLGARDIVVTTNIQTYKRGGLDIPYTDQRKVQDDPGVAVYYTWKSEQYALACDRWKTVADNLQALQKTVDAIRGLERWGTGEMVKAAFAGFKALPEKEVVKDWWTVLGLVSFASVEAIKARYRELSMIHHPDRPGGNKEKFIEINNAYEKALAAK